MKCPRCGKKKHDGACSFDSSKKSMLEEQEEKMKTLKIDTDSLKKVKDVLS